MLSVDPISTAVVFLLVVLVRVLPQHADRSPTSAELTRALMCAGLLVGLGGVWLGAFSLSDARVVTTSDFSEYCQSVAAELDQTPRQWSANRSRLSGLPAVWAARHLGVADGLLVGAFVGQALLGVGLYLWGRALHSPLAGVAAAICACGLAPLAVLGRMLTFYPVIVGSLTLATGLVATAWARPTRWTALLAGVGVGLALLVDLRGLLWALPLLGTAMVGLLRPTRGVLGRVGLLVAPVVVAWELAAWAYPPHTTTLEVLSDLTKGWHGIVWVVHVPAPATADTGYIWGRSPLTHLPDTLLWLAEQGRRVPPSLRTHPHTVQALGQLLSPLVPWLAGCTGLTMLGLIRRPGRLLLLAGTALPFAVTLEGAIAARFAGMRFLGNGAPVLAVVAGVGLAVLAGAGRRPLPKRAGPSPRSVAAWIVLVALMVGTIPSVLSPLSHWRGRFKNADAGLLTGCTRPTGVPEAPTWVWQLP